MRLGEVLRVWLVARWLTIPAATVGAPVGVESFLHAFRLTLTAELLVLLVPMAAYLVGAAVYMR